MSAHFLAWLAFIAPTCLTPGPINIISAATSARYGWRSVLPFLFGVNLVNLGFCSAAWFGLEGAVQRYPDLLMWFRWFGAGFLIYLSYKFYRSARTKIATEASRNKPTFLDGVIVNGLNVKTVLVFAVTFAEFAHIGAASQQVVLFYALGALGFCLLAQTSWTAGGRLITRMWNTEGRTISYGSAATLFVVAIWIAVGH